MRVRVVVVVVVVRVRSGRRRDRRGRWRQLAVARVGPVQHVILAHAHAHALAQTLVHLAKYIRTARRIFWRGGVSGEEPAG